MPRRNGKAGGRKFDTRLSFNEMARIMKILPRQKIIMRRYLIQRLRGGGHL